MAHADHLGIKAHSKSGKTTKTNKK
jgi:hypothetical protein